MKESMEDLRKQSIKERTNKRRNEISGEGGKEGRIRRWVDGGIFGEETKH
jgi:hypothetical protein